VDSPVPRKVGDSPMFLTPEVERLSIDDVWQ
jgi:hypothetical protein